jgi:DNA polymerase III delta prime subunit
MTEPIPPGSPLCDELIAALSRLDAMLAVAVRQMHANNGPEEAPDFLRGLQIRASDVARVLRTAPGVPVFREAADGNGVPPLAAGVPRLDWLGRAFALNAFDLNVVLLALAPEIDLRYERLYAYLQDDITRKRPIVELALHLFAPDAESKLALRRQFAADAPLLRYGLIHLIPDAGQAQPPLLSHYLKLADQAVDFVLGQDTLDRRLAPFCQLLEATSTSPDDERLRSFRAFAADSRAQGRPVRMYLQGTAVSGKLEAARAIAGVTGLRLLAVNLALAPEGTALQPVLQLASLASRMLSAALYVEGVDTLMRDPSCAGFATLMQAFADTGVAILSGTLPWHPTPRGPAGVLSLDFGALDLHAARECWLEQTGRRGISLPDSDLNLMAGRFRLTAEQIADAVACAENAVRWSSQSALTLDHLAAAARAECGHELAKLARKISPNYAWEDFVLPEDQLAQLHEICEQAAHRQTVFGQWGFGRKLSLGKGLNVLFSGPPGTGKTMAAEVIANELRLDLYKIDLSQVVSKYIGETEKNLDRVFSAAEHSNAILFFDEADALFGKRSEVKDSHDRYANIEIGYLLQKMEEYEGIAILATNVKHHIDEAFVRRIQMIVEFPFPDEAERHRVWQVIFPKEAPLEADVDFGALARTVRLASGNIRSIARTSAFYAAADGCAIQMAHVLKASRREYQKLGRAWTGDEWGNSNATKSTREASA